MNEEGFTTIPPLPITYQAGKVTHKKIFGTSGANEWAFKDSGYEVSSDNTRPMDQRTYDVVILEATGFTGGLVVRHLIKTYGVHRKDKFAIAGLSQEKLDAVKARLSKELKINEIKDIRTIFVNTTNTATMPSLVQDTRVIATTASLYSLYGSPVVELCAKFGTHYVKVPEEINWIKYMSCKRTRERPGKWLQKSLCLLATIASLGILW